jgi:A118 family predicted phage portal protein
MLWSLLNNKTAKINTSDSLMCSYIQKWELIYRGMPDWLNYSYIDMNASKIECKKKSLNASKMIVQEMARLCWSEKPEIIADDSIIELFQKEKFFDNIIQFTEKTLALGGGAIKIYIENMQIKIEFVPATRFVPVSYSPSGVITGADFLDSRVIEKEQYLRVESHRIENNKVVIRNTGWKLAGNELYPVNISIFGEYEEETTLDISTPLFSYIRVTGDNNLVDETALGISFFANAIDTLESIDTAFDALQREIKLGKRRIIVPAEAVRTVTDSNGNIVRYYDPSDEALIAFNSGDKEDMKIIDNSVSLRIVDIRLAIQTLIDILSVQTGFSAGYLSFDGVSMKTATEIISENSKTFKTKVSIENEIKTSIIDIMNSVREIGRFYGLATTGIDYNIIFNDSIIEDRNSKAKYWFDRYNNETCTLERVLQELDGLSQEDAIIEAEKIRKSKASIDVNSLFGGYENIVDEKLKDNEL